MTTLALRYARSRFAQTIADASIQVKLLVFMLGTLILLLGVTISSILYALGEFEEQVSAERLVQERALLAQHVAGEQDELKERATGLALEPDVVAAVGASDSEAVQPLVAGLRIRYQLDHLEIVNRDNYSLISDQPIAEVFHRPLHLALLNVKQTSVVATPQGALLIATVPIADSQGVQGAILVGRFIDNTFLQHINANRTDPVILLHGTNGQVLASTISDRHGPMTPQPLSPELWQQALNGEIVDPSESAPDGTPRRVMYTPLLSGKQSGLVYSIALTTAQIHDFRVQTIQQSVLFSVLVGAIAFGVLFYFTRRFIVGPLSGLSSTAAQLGAGNLDIQLPTHGRDEIGRLATSFGEMAQQLRQSFATLDQQNRSLQQEIAERKRTEEARAQLQEEVFLAQTTILEMSTPLIPLSKQIVVLPLIGTLDSRRAQQVFETLLHGIESSKARVAILDITGIPVIDAEVAEVMVRVAQAVRLLGARVVLTGIRPEVAQSLVGLGVDLRELATYSTLEDAIASVQQPAGRSKRP